MDMPKRVENFVNYVEQVESKSRGTAEGYGIDICLFFKWLLHERDLDFSKDIESIDVSKVDDNLIKTVTSDDLEMFVGYIDKVRNNAKSTKARKIASLKKFFKYAYKKCKLLDKNIAEDLISPKINRKTPSYLSQEDGMKLLNHILASKDKYALRDFTMIYLYLSNGLRLTELINVDLKHISLENKTIEIVGKGDIPATIYITDEAVNVLKVYLEWRDTIKDNLKSEDSNSLFVSRFNTRIGNKAVQKFGKKYMEQIGLDTSKYHIHSFRHSFCMSLYKNGCDLRTMQQLMRHSNLNVTAYYFRSEEEKMRQAGNTIQFFGVKDSK